MSNETKLEKRVKQLENNVYELEERVKQLENRVSKIEEHANPPIGKVIYKKCHICNSDLVPPLKIVHENDSNNNVIDYIVCPICYGQTCCRKEVFRFN